MGTTLTGTTPQDTYDSLIKVTDNGPISATAKFLSDGLGNDSVLALSTARVGIGTTTLGALLTIGGGTANNFSDGIQLSKSGGNTYAIYPSTNNLEFRSVTGGNHIATFDYDGKVGIGTSAPTELLELAAATDPKIRFLDTGNIDAKVGIIASSALGFELNALERMRIVSDGTLRLSVNSGGIQFNGDTAAANALDDYEEGTWTMGVSFGGASVGVTYSQNTGTYTKIGRQVTVNGFLILTNKGSSTGSATITGLPYVIANTQGNYSVPALRFEHITFANQFQAFGNINATTISLEEVTALGTITSITNADFANNSQIIISFTYFV